MRSLLIVLSGERVESDDSFIGGVSHLRLGGQRLQLRVVKSDVDQSVRLQKRVLFGVFPTSAMFDPSLSW